MRLPAPVRELVRDQIAALDQLEARRSAYAEQIAAQAKHSGSAPRLQTIAGVGPTTAAAFVATVGAPQDFRNGRQFAAWRGLTPKQHSTACNNGSLPCWRASAITRPWWRSPTSMRASSGRCWRKAKAITGQSDVCRPRLPCRPRHEAVERRWSKRAVFHGGPRQSKGARGRIVRCSLSYVIAQSASRCANGEVHIAGLGRTAEQRQAGQCDLMDVTMIRTAATAEHI